MSEAAAAPRSPTRSGKELAVLVILQAGDEVLLMRRTKAFLQGMYIPIGGHVEPHETVRQAAIREAREEAGVEVSELTLTGPRLCGVLQETSPVGYNWLVYVYAAQVPRFDPPACDEGVLEWVPLGRLTEVPTPPTDLHIYRLVREGRPFVLDAEYDGDLHLVSMREELRGEWLVPPPAEGERP